MSADGAASPPPPMQKKSSSGDQLDSGARRATSALPIAERSAIDARGASPAAPSRIMIVPTKTPRDGEGGDSKDDLKVQGSTIGGSSLRVRFVSPDASALIPSSREETKSKSLFQKIETKLGLGADSNVSAKDKAEKADKKSRKPTRNERDSIMISRPTSMVHKTHVDREFQWTGENADKAFQLETKIGGGAYGSVYKAIHKETGFVLAIKVVQVSRAEQDELKKEVEILKKCKEYHIVHYYGTCAKDDSLWILMDYCGIGSVLDLMKCIKRTLTEEEIAVIILSVLKGLSYLHREGIIHRDLKSANILLTEAMEPKISDFGVSAQIGNMISNKAKTVVGTPLFMSPEVLDGATHDTKTDIWSVGIMCIELAEGQPPYSNEHVLRAMKLLCTEPPPKLKDTGKYSDLFHSFIAICLQKEAEKRPSAVELLTHPYITWIINNTAADIVPKRLVAEYEKNRSREVIKANLEERLAENRSPARAREPKEADNTPVTSPIKHDHSPDKPPTYPLQPLPEQEERGTCNELPLETIDEHGPPTAAPPPIPVDEPLVATPSKDDKDKDKEERKKDSDGESKAEIKSSRPRHKNSTHVHKGASSEPSPRRQNSTPEMSPSLKESSGSAVQAEKIAQYERRVAELESLLDASRRHAQQLEKQLLQERQLAADMEALLNAANDMRAASAKFDAACKDIAQRRAGGKKGSDEHLKI